MKNPKVNAAAKQSEKALRSAREYVEEKKEELAEAMESGRKGWVEKSQKALAGIEKAVSELSKKIEVYKKEPILDEKRKRQALIALGAAAAAAAALIGVSKLRSGKDEGGEAEDDEDE